jgi:hypothetical protein
MLKRLSSQLEGRREKGERKEKREEAILNRQEEQNEVEQGKYPETGRRLTRNASAVVQVEAFFAKYTTVASAVLARVNAS